MDFTDTIRLPKNSHLIFPEKTNEALKEFCPNELNFCYNLRHQICQQPKLCVFNIL